MPFDRSMDFGLTPEQQEYRRAVLRFAQSDLADDVIRRDADQEFPVEAWKRCAAFGIQGLPVPEKYGGGGADPVTIAAAMEALGEGCTDNGLLFSLGAHMWSCEVPIVRFGRDDQRRRYLPALCDGSLIGVQGMTEPESGSDALSLSTTAVRDGDGYVLDGSKTFITNAPVGGLFVVFASTEQKLGFAGLSAFLVERDSPGLTVGPPARKMGLRTSPMSELIFDGCRVPGEAILGREGAGMAIFNRAMDWERGYILAPAVGSMHRLVDQCARYARERRQFGQAIGSFQAVSHRIVAMRVRLETSRMMLYRQAWLRAEGRPTEMAAAMTKLHLSDSLVQISLDALQIHGGYGYMVDTEFERHVRDALASRIYSGTSEIQRNLIARLMQL